MSNLPEPPIELQDKVAAIIYQWDRIERWDCTYVAYTELSDALKDTLRKLAIAAIATIPTHPTPDRDGLIEKLEAAAHGGELSLIDAIALVRQHGAKQVMGEPPSIGAEEIGSEGAATPSPANQQREMRLLTPEAIEAELSKNSRYLHEPLTGNERKLLRDTLALLRPYLRTTEPVIVKLGAAEALSKAILEAHAKWAAEYQGVGHVG